MVIEPYLDLINAKQHREQNRGLTDAYYDQQARAVAQWGLGTAKPPSVRVGELPLVDMNKLGIQTHATV